MKVVNDLPSIGILEKRLMMGRLLWQLCYTLVPPPIWM
jgi:hypothetical protein